MSQQQNPKAQAIQQVCMLSITVILHVLATKRLEDPAQANKYDIIQNSYVAYQTLLGTIMGSIGLVLAIVNIQLLKRGDFVKILYVAGLNILIGIGFMIAAIISFSQTVSAMGEVTESDMLLASEGSGFWKFIRVLYYIGNVAGIIVFPCLLCGICVAIKAMSSQGAAMNQALMANYQ